MSYQIAKRGVTGDFKFIWIEDPALDSTDEEALFEAYRLYDETDDESHLPIRPGMRPVRWTLRYLTSMERRYVSEFFPEKQARGIFKAAQLAIKATTAMSEDNRPVDIDRKGVDKEGFSVVDEKLLEALDGDPNTAGLVNAIGIAVINKSQPGKKS